MWLLVRAQHNSNANLLPIHQFKTQYRFSEAYHMSQMRDLQPVAGAIIWARQIERQLVTYMKHVEDMLGKGWILYAEGQKLQSESTAFRKKLDTCLVFEAWLHDINRRNMGVDGRLFEIVRLRGGGFQLAVNFDTDYYFVQGGEEFVVA
jgi:hypothetical protein